jgi:DNA-directed RNA polymerase III subunit RPC4
MFAQEVVAIDTREKQCSSVGELGKCAIVTPDIDYLLDSTHLSTKE